MKSLSLFRYTGLLFACVLLGMICSSVYAQQTEADLVQYVNTLQGTASSPGYSTGNVYPTVALPFGVNFWSPQTGHNGDGWKYRYDELSIRGFGQTHQCSPWMNDYGVFTLMPITGQLIVNEDKRASSFTHKNEKAAPDSYEVRFDNGIKAGVTPTERGAVFQFDYPKNNQAYLLLDGYTGLSDFHIDQKRKEITGFVRNGLFIPGNFKNYVVVRFNVPFESFGSWDGKTGEITKGALQVNGEKKGLFLGFKKGTKLEVKVASSYISLDQAKLNLDREIGVQSFQQIKKEAHKIWNEKLGQIEVKGKSEPDLQTFYSCLFRSSLFPCKFYDLDAKGNPYYYSPNDGKLHQGYFYTDDGYWDTFRAKFPLYNILQPTMQGRYMKAILAVKRECGWLPSWSFPGETGGVMIGNHAISVLTDAWMKGIHSFNPDTALAYYLHEVSGSAPDGRYGRKESADYFKLGFVPYKSGEVGSTAKTLEYCYDDFCAYQLAKATGNRFYEQIFARQLYNYKKVFNPATGFMEGRDSLGRFDPDFNPFSWGGPFVEGNSWHYSWSVFHDVAGLIQLMGGNKAFIQKIDHLFNGPDSIIVGSYRDTIHEMREMVTAKMGQYAQGNEPIEHLPYLYSYAGAPWKTQLHVRAIMRKLFNAGPEGYPGDEDQGQMSAWYVLNALGLYSVCPGTSQYVIGSPLFDKATIHLENGHDFIIETHHNSAENIYIQSALLNGEPFTANYLDYNTLMEGGTLVFEMGPLPNKQRGTGTQDLPYSLSDLKPQVEKK
ncbi:alpha-1,2-mannosidase, putative [Arachidicoccus rhizosphaerae]|uniref:Alpha-1,2-mannosidase, putative n=1 Tax=Arachidicoccus rhizosphaerae TaxID=551991 RepID=A0A1H4BCM4_9BACT|nr:GH92 family glycosyl hydrolase [Arachidicoccus rhizosphaerae]SEA45899.1 alpha-1,2-mannosidase, putative [Arachidicoccus rhizosphaerae]